MLSLHRNDPVKAQRAASAESPTHRRDGAGDHRPRSREVLRSDGKGEAREEAGKPREERDEDDEHDRRLGPHIPLVIPEDPPDEKELDQDPENTRREDSEGIGRDIEQRERREAPHLEREQPGDAEPEPIVGEHFEDEERGEATNEDLEKARRRREAKHLFDLIGGAKNCNP